VKGRNVKKERLIVVVFGIRAKRKRWEPLLSRLKKEPELNDENAVWLVFDPKCGVLSRKPISESVRDLMALIHTAWISNGGFEDIILVGHSLGGMIIRSAYVAARGADPNAPGEFAWGFRVHRIVLLAAPNRGIKKFKSPILATLDWVVRQIPGLNLTYQSLMRGSNFVTNLRINWIKLFAIASNSEVGNEIGDVQNRSLPMVIQVLGTHDGIVGRDDSVDVLAFPGTAAVEVPNTDHDHLIEIDSTAEQSRYVLIRAAILHPEELDVSGIFEKRFNPGARNVVYILHGIRASNIDNWLREVADVVKVVYPPNTEVIRPSYGYFSAWSFAVPKVRRKNIRHFQDVFTENLARNPYATVDFIGHSNGTYMLGQSLRDISGMRFRNVVVAGSVLPADYPWDGKLGIQVGKIRSERGRKDWPVAWLCSGLNRGLGMKDVGTGGYSGFTRGLVEEENFHPGGHASMFSRDNIIRMVTWANNGTPGAELPSQVPELSWWSRISRLCPHLVRAVLVALMAGVFYLIWTQNLVSLGILVAVFYGIYLILDII
jgi:pimeloyl-ACP methyl ester carboxylesterase